MSAKIINTAIIITNPYNDFLHPKGKLNSLIAESLAEKNVHVHLKQLVDAARAHHIPIYYGLHQQFHDGSLEGRKHATKLQQIQMQTGAFGEGTWGVEIYEGLEPQPSNGDVVVSKHWCSREITNLVMAGMTANDCLEGSARYAYELGYHITMLKDCTAGMAKNQVDAATELIWPIFAHEVKTVGDWISTLDK